MKNVVPLVVLISFLAAISTVSLMFFVVGINVTVHMPSDATTSTSGTTSTCQPSLKLSSVTLYRSANNVSKLVVGLTSNNCNSAGFTVGSVTLSGGGMTSISGTCSCSMPLPNGTTTVTYIFDSSQVNNGQTYNFVMQTSDNSISGSLMAQ